MLAIPLLPLLLYQGKKIRKKVPQLPEAMGNTGISLPSEKSEKQLNLITIGESTIAGVGVDTHEEGFTGTLAKGLADLTGHKIKWKVYARSGYTAKTVNKKLIPKIKEKEIDLIVIGLGGNDAFTLNSPKNWKKEIVNLINTLNNKFSQTPIVFCNMPPVKVFPAFTFLIRYIIGNHVELLGKELKNIVKGLFNVYYSSDVITLEKWLEKLPKGVSKNDFFSDGVHPSKLTYQTWANEIANFIVNEKVIR